MSRVRAFLGGLLWVAIIVAALLMIALLIFIAQNSTSVMIHFLGFSGQISLAVALLLAAVGGVLLVAIPGTARIVQLRRALKKNGGSIVNIGGMSAHIGSKHRVHVKTAKAGLVGFTRGSRRLC